MEYILTAVLTAVFTILFIGLYKYAVNPQMIIRPTMDNMSLCPDNWSYVESEKKCVPTYPTSCSPFDPKAPTLDNVVARCNMARLCGTTWSGFCR